MGMCRCCGPKHNNPMEDDVSGGGFFLSEPSSRDHVDGSPTSRGLPPPWQALISPPQPRPPALGGPRRHLQLVGFDPCAFVSASFELGRELLGVRPSHGLAFLQWGVVGEGSLQQHPGTLEGCCQERRGEPGPLPGEAARGKDRPPPLRTSGNCLTESPWGSTCWCGKVVRGTDTIFKNPGSPDLPCGLTQTYGGACLGSTSRCAGCPWGARCS